MRYYGVDYYPEQWGLSHLEEDLEGIRELGCNIIRIADFAWDILEPEDGVYDFSLFDTVVERAAAHGLKVMMCTPSATMPAWLYQAHPEIMIEDEQGHRQPYGARRGYCMNHPYYVEKAAAVARAMARHYRGNKNVVLWQTDNEVGHEGSDLCFCENCRKGFVSFLKERYSSIGELNERWGTSFWSQMYSSFDQIPLPRHAFVAQNPSLRLEWERFRSDTVHRYLKALYDAVKSGDPDAEVVHDFSGGQWSKHYDTFAMADCMDTAAYNNYPVWGGQAAPMAPHAIAFTLDTARGWKQKDFIVTESIMGAQGHDVIGCAPKPGEAKKWALDSIRHGVESILFFRYRGFTKGAEQLCFGILDADNQKRRRYRETQEFFAEAAPQSPPTEKNRAVLIYDFDSAAAWRIQRQSDAMDYEAEAMKLYKQFFDRGIGVDILSPDRDIRGYEYVVVPAMVLMKEDFKAKLKEAVAEGAAAVLTFRTAWKDRDDNFTFGQRLPCGLTDLTGCMLEEHEALLKDQTASLVMDGTPCEGEVFKEMLTLTTAEPVACLTGDPFGDYPVCSVNRYGKGTCWYLGTSLKEEALTSLFRRILE